MVREFKKVGAAAAVAGALLASSASYAAVQLSTPGDVMLVPYVRCEDAASADRVNTLVGLITFYKERMGLSQTVDGAIVYYPAPAGLTGLTGLPIDPGLPARLSAKNPVTRTLHWYFYNSRSEHIIDGIIPITDNDFVRFDWCDTIQTLGVAGDLEGVDGYLIFVDDRADTASSTVFPVPSFALYGHAYQIEGDWASQAFIPILANPVYSWDFATGSQQYNLEKRAGYPAFRRMVVGTDYTDLVDDGVTLQRDLFMRYFLDPALATENRMVFWFNTNQDDLRESVPGETYDSEQVYKASFSYPLPNELNVVVSTPTDRAFPGMNHTEAESYGSKATVVNTGIVRFGIPEVYSTVSFTSSGVSFNMLGLGAGGNAAQLQTEMSTEGEDYFLF